MEQWDRQNLYRKRVAKLKEMKIICFHNPNEENGYLSRGQNLLGYALMEVREQLR